jgi:DNA-3-methyladenine glycosylase II
MCRWFLSLHKIIVSPDKKPTVKQKSKVKKGKKAHPDEPPATPMKDSTELPVSEEESPMEMTSGAVQLPPAFTPSIQKTLNKEPEFPPPELPDGMSVSVLKARLSGKKVKCVPSGSH